jgi:hypothetical protein
MAGTNAVPATLGLLLGWLDNEFLGRGPRSELLASVLLPSELIVRGGRAVLALSCKYDNIEQGINLGKGQQKKPYEKGVHSDMKAPPWNSYMVLA